MKIIQAIQSKNFLLIIYKLLHDALFLTLATFAIALIAEGLLPGIISTHISMARIVIIIILLLGSIASLGSKLNITYDTPKIRHNKLLPFLVLFAFLMIGNSMLKFALWENLVITITTLFVFYLLYRLMYDYDKEK